MRHTSLLAVLAIAATALAPSAQGGEIVRPSAQSEFTWTSTECVRPVKPFIRRDDPMRQAQLRRFTDQIARYIDCMKREAQRDFDRIQLDMQRAVERSLQKEVDAMNDAMEAAIVQSR